ncbi:uncharacterized protein SPSC_05458 [Sporisorium scitamineum]|uniref:F-box domain-containing protein n=1 Tax=Sporisorium scitamineum TaxID=49012 RepID=A0A0F7RSK2_9BASI|nr:hypothetical protein [Sporisorium scitamineum]CDU25565.1 uncharacterized protein SPSC_05458 [Sporisorium scitamineum]
MNRGWLNDRRPAATSAPAFSAMEQLPHEVLFDIFAYLDVASLAHLAATSSRIRRVALQDILWKPFVSHAVHSLSPPVHGPHIHPLESTLPLWHPDFGLQANDTHPPSWPTPNEYISQEPAAGAVHNQPEAELHLFQGATSLYQVFVSFVRAAEPLLGWWASDVPFYGMVIRVVLDMHFSYEIEAASEFSSADSCSSSPAPRHASTNGAKRHSPAIVCQRVYLTNRLQGLDSDMHRWSQVTGFPMPTNSTVIGQGTILRRSLTQIRTDLCEPGIRTENLWHFSWDDVQRGGNLPNDIASPSSALALSSPTIAKTERQAEAKNDVLAHISNQSWLRSLGPQDGSMRSFRRVRGGVPHVDDDEEDDSDGLEDGAEEIDRALRQAVEAPAFFNFGFDLEEDGPVPNRLRQLLVGPHTNDLQRPIWPAPDAIPTEPNEAGEESRVHVSLNAWQPYIDAEERNAPFAQPPSIVMPLPPAIFPPPALLPAIRSPPWSRLGKVQIGMSDIWETLSAERRWLIEGEKLTIESLTMTPPPPYRPWPILAHTLESGPRFFPICNPSRTSAQLKPLVQRPRTPPETTTSGSLRLFSSELNRASSELTSTDRVVYQHIAPPPQHDPAHVDFDWDAVEGLYSMTYGPHGIELLYIRARELTSLDFEPDDRLPAWPAEPLLSSDNMYEQTRISRRSAARVGARVLEAVKVLGDPNIPRGQVTWRAFIDDPGRSAVAWRSPPEGFRRHTPWPLRPPHAVSSQDERSPGLVLPAHGRVAEEGFVGPGWATALACISSIDEILIWWQPMYKISIAKKLIGV